MTDVARIESLHVYPVKSCRVTTLTQVRLGSTGFEHDREWVIVNERGRFITQREVPRLALIVPEVQADGIRLSASGAGAIDVAASFSGERRAITVWRDTLDALDAGEAAARWLSEFLHAPVRLMRMAPDTPRVSSQEWTGQVKASIAFSDGYPILAISTASLADLNARLPVGHGPLPINRFRPNIVLSGIDAYAEDRIDELRSEGVVLRIVKPCTRCKITTTDQATAEVMGEEPLTTLKTYRWSESLRGVTFGQNVIAIDSVGAKLEVGQQFRVTWK